MRDVPYIVHESDMARQERIIKRLCVLCLVLILALIGTNAAWIYYESQWQYVETSNNEQMSQNLRAEDGTAIINDGIHVNGRDTSELQKD